MKFKWFKFYFCYREVFETVSFLHCKKLILAVMDYAEKGNTKIKLKGKTLKAFEKIKLIFEREKILAQSFGKDGAKRRWQGGKNGNRRKK